MFVFWIFLMLIIIFNCFSHISGLMTDKETEAQMELFFNDLLRKGKLD